MNEPPPPYRPLRGAQPPHFADRADEDDLGDLGIVAGSLAAYDWGPADPRFHRLVYGPEAAGKTALLRAVAQRVAADGGWAVAKLRGRPKQSALGALVEAIVPAMERRWPGRPGSVLRSIGRHPSSGGVAWPGPRAGVPGCQSWAALYQLARAAGRVAADAGSGLLVVVDDAERLLAGELEALGHLARALSAEGSPVAFLLAGPPVLERRCSRASHFGACLWPTRLGLLQPAEAREALVVPAAERGVDIGAEAVQLICAAAGGSPLDLQRLAFASWSVAIGPGAITRADAEKALALTCAPRAQRAS
jgi:hypothetical protein